VPLPLGKNDLIDASKICDCLRRDFLPERSTSVHIANANSPRRNGDTLLNRFKYDEFAYLG
jgi:hypothetical protein